VKEPAATVFPCPGRLHGLLVVSEVLGSARNASANRFLVRDYLD
jgi:hypothetical protein